MSEGPAPEAASNARRVRGFLAIPYIITNLCAVS
ncbi:uncharacterized protein METZ01_LOCUS414412, partial [marine metagenome]